jgi:ABC-2 type transport system permease protein
MNAVVHNVGVIARREFTVRARTRSFLLGTAVLVLGVLGIAFVPTILSYLDRSDAREVGVWVDATDLASDPVATLDALLGGSADPATPGGGTVRVHRVDDLAAAREAVVRGEMSAVLAIERSPDDELAFTLYTDDLVTGRTAQLAGQAVNAVAIADRLARLGIEAGDQAGLFAPASYGVMRPDPDRADPGRGDPANEASYLLGFGMTVLIFMMIVLYGNWVAVSVVEEKSGRVMEVILNAATPFQLLAGKVLGVGAVALVQYVGMLAAGLVALLVQAPVAAALLGDAGDAMSLPAGLTVWVLLAFGLYGVLGFLLYAVLYAAAASLVSRQEDVSQAVAPMSLVSTVGYFIAIWAATGMLDAGSSGIAVLSQVPFVSPFLMLSRLAAGEAGPTEVLLSVAILVASIIGALWLAARIYATGVLLYGQRPGWRTVVGIVRGGS